MRWRLRPLGVTCAYYPHTQRPRLPTPTAPPSPAAGIPTPPAPIPTVNPTAAAIPILSILDKIFHRLGKVLVGWHRRRFGYAWKQRDTRGRCNDNNCGAAKHATQKSAAIYGIHDFPPVAPIEFNQESRRKFPRKETRELSAPCVTTDSNTPPLKLPPRGSPLQMRRLSRLPNSQKHWRLLKETERGRSSTPGPGLRT